MRKHLPWIVPALLAASVCGYLLSTSVESLPLLARRHVTRVYDHDFQYGLFLPAATVEGLLRRPDDFVFRRRSILGV